jgi:hypothetical protein
MKTLADRIINFNSSLNFEGALPDNISIMNPFLENPNALEASSRFYRKYYSDNTKRKLILGINPGRLGAGVTGVPFTDTKRLKDPCGIVFDLAPSHEPSSVFIYDVIQKMGGPEQFYNQFYINSVCPLGFLIEKPNGKKVNYNYYDSKELAQTVMDFIIQNLKTQIELGMETEACYVLGNNKNFNFVNFMNKKLSLFKVVIPMAHPRYIMQYKLKSKETFIADYINKLNR